MAGGFLEFGIALVAFIGSHAVAGLPGIRGRLLAGLGARTYRIAYSVVSLALLTWVISAAIRAPYVGLWGPFPWTTALLVTVMAPVCVLLAASVLEPNPFSLSFARGPFNLARPGTAGLIRHPIAPAIIESCPQRIFLPNERAVEPQARAVYERFGLNARQIDLIAQATPKREYYLQSRRGNRLFQLGLGPLALALCGASDPAAQTLIDSLSDTPAGAPFAADLIEAEAEGTP